MTGTEISRGLERILTGSFKKMVIADVLLKALMPDLSLLEHGAPLLSWHQVLFASFLRLLTTYFDFSGYTDMVLGTSRLFGIRLMENFHFPLFRTSLPDFWRSWHISLTSWVRDYVYYPILITLRNTDLAIFATMVTIGLWHSPKPGWLCWGLHHAVGLILVSRFTRWAAQNEAIQKWRGSFGWRAAGLLGSWYYISLAYSLTIFPEAGPDFGKLYMKLLTFGLL